MDEKIDKDTTLPTKNHAERDRRSDKDGAPFIPIGLPYSVPGGPYTEDDPEWKTFKTYAADTAQFKQLRGRDHPFFAETFFLSNIRLLTHFQES